MTLLAVVAGTLVVAASGCATLEKVSTDARLGVESRITKPMTYRLAGVDPAVRTNLDRARSELAARNYRAAVPLLNRAVWDLERIARRGLRLGELVTVYDGLGRRPRWEPMISRKSTGGSRTVSARPERGRPPAA